MHKALKSVVLVTFVLLGTSVLAQVTENPSLKTKMKQMNSLLKQVQPVVEDNAAAMDAPFLANLRSLEDVVNSVLVEVPTSVSEIKDPTDQRVFLLEYKKAILSLESKLFELEQAALHAKKADAQAILKEILAMKKSGHGTFDP